MTEFDITSEKERYHIALLLDCYGAMLTQKQRKTLELYFQEDLSLSEISELSGVSRQAVRDSIRLGIKTLRTCDEKLEFLDKIATYEKRIAELEQKITGD